MREILSSKVQRYTWYGLVFAILLVLAPACVHPGGLGDRAFEAGDYSTALRYYEEEMADGPHDWKLYYRAAQASTRLGSFSSAERYFSLSLRYGGGVDVATDLAAFYVQTSNYARAVRVYQFLLKHTDDPQPVYNNLGTALMYAGLPFDAESYLMISQQMDSKNPLPYINLGVLYDQHLKQPQLAHAFFACFMELSPNTSQSTRVVQSRLEEMKLRPYSVGEVEGFTCGEPYVPVQRTVTNLKKHFEGPEWQDKEGDEAVKVIELGIKESETVESTAASVSEVIIDRGNDAADAKLVADTTKSAEIATTLPAARERAEVALRTKNYEQVVKELSSYPVDTLQASDMLMLGTAFARNGRTKDALPWLEWSFKREPAPETLEALLNSYLMLDDNERVSELCKRYIGKSEFKAATKRCTVTDDGK